MRGEKYEEKSFHRLRKFYCTLKIIADKNHQKIIIITHSLSCGSTFTCVFGCWVLRNNLSSIGIWNSWKKDFFFVHSINKILAKCSVGSNGKLVETRNFTIYPFEAVLLLALQWNSVRKEKKLLPNDNSFFFFMLTLCVEIYIGNVWIIFDLALRFVEIRVGFGFGCSKFWLEWQKNGNFWDFWIIFKLFEENFEFFLFKIWFFSFKI